MSNRFELLDTGCWIDHANGLNFQDNLLEWMANADIHEAEQARETYRDFNLENELKALGLIN